MTIDQFLPKNRVALEFEFIWPNPLTATQGASDKLLLASFVFIKCLPRRGTEVGTRDHNNDTFKLLAAAN